jgi:NAD(P)H-flavin reductase
MRCVTHWHFHHRLRHNCSSAGESQRPLLLIATGTGLAAIAGILQTVLAQGHCGPVRLYHGVRQARDLYLHKTLQALADEHANLHYYGCVSGASGADTSGIEAAKDMQQGRAADLEFSTS